MIVTSLKKFSVSQHNIAHHTSGSKGQNDVKVQVLPPFLLLKA